MSDRQTPSAAHKLGDPTTDEQAALAARGKTGEEGPRTTPVGSPEARSAATRSDRVLWLGQLVADELEKAMRRFPEFNSPHEGYAVIREELDELWDEIKTTSGRTIASSEEAVQIAAMALRYVHDLIDWGPGA